MMRTRAGIGALLLVAIAGIAGVIALVQDGARSRDPFMAIDSTLREPAGIGSSTAVPNHYQITINGDAQLDAFSEKTGSGTAQDPYVIRDLVIDGSGNVEPFVLKNTRKHVDVINCTTLDSSYYSGGFSCNGVENVQIKGCTATRCRNGIYISGSRNVNVTGCVIVYGEYGVFVWSSGVNISVRHCNIAYTTYEGIYWSSCSNAYGSTVMFNEISDIAGPQSSVGDGIHVSDTKGLLISSNSIRRCKGFGIYMWFSEDTTITRNWISFNYRGIMVRNVPTGVIYNNTFVNNTNGHVDIYYGDATCVWNDHGIGNYWSGYTTRYPAATNNNITWNTPYVIAGTQQDKHPLVRTHDTPYPPNQQDINTTASFTMNATTSIANSRVAFTFTGNVGNVPASFNWDFGDGLANSTLQSPIYTFRTAGIHTVTVTITDADGDTSTFSRPYCITILPDYRPVANFTASATTVVPGTSVMFTYTGTEGNAPLSFLWYFSGSGMGYVRTRNPTVVYPTTGTYYVDLRVTDVDGDTNFLFMSNFITVTNATPDLRPAASFTANATSIVAGQDVAFTYTGTGGDGLVSYQWCFNDGSANETCLDPVHRFSTPGSFLAKLTVIDRDGDASTATSNVPIAVVADAAPVARFTKNATILMVSQSVQFNFAGNEGNAPAAFKWDFGDGSAGSGSRDPCHRFSTWGMFTVTLEVTDRDGDKGTVVESACVVVLPRVTPLAQFSVLVTPSGQNQYVQFTFTGDQGHGIASYAWEFGDGSVSGEEDPVHIYSRPGEYNVTLTVTDIFGNSARASRVVSISAAFPPLAEQQPARYESIYIPVILLGLVLGAVASRMSATRKTTRHQAKAAHPPAADQALVTGREQGVRDILDEIRALDARQPDAYFMNVVETADHVRKMVIRKTQIQKQAYT